MEHSTLLTEREREVVKHLADGLNAREIADLLKIETGTVRNHRQNIYRKLRINRAAALARWAVEQGLVRAKRNGRKRSAA